LNGRGGKEGREERGNGKGREGIPPKKVKVSTE